MKIELRDALKLYIAKIEDGDILNVPTLHKQDFEKVCFYMLAQLNNRLISLEKLLEKKTLEKEEKKPLWGKGKE